MSISTEWSVSAYMDRMEKASLKIQEEREPLDHALVLWWGLDGLRLNEDGTMEWISRKKKVPAPASLTPQYMPTISCQAFDWASYMPTCSLADMRQTMDRMRMETIQSELNRLSLETAQAAQAASLPFLAGTLQAQALIWR